MVRYNGLDDALDDGLGDGLSLLHESLQIWLIDRLGDGLLDVLLSERERRGEPRRWATAAASSVSHWK